MKRIIGIFTAFLLPALPAFGASSEFGSFKGFEQTYDSCRIDVNSDSMSLEISNLPEKYQTMYKNHAKETVTTATQGKCNGVAYTCKPGDLVTCNPCEMFFYFQEIKELYIENTIEEKCGHLKKTSKKTNTSSSTTTTSAANSDFDFVAAQKNANKEKACTETDGKWNNKTNECKCKTGFTISREGKCVSTYDEEKANSCAETGGKWTKKNTCNCKNGWNLDADGFCQPNDKTAANNHKKELCTEPNKWNDTLKKCTCKDKKQFFDEETGCVSASADFLAAETELNTLKQQFETKKAELASAN